VEGATKGATEARKRAQPRCNRGGVTVARRRARRWRDGGHNEGRNEGATVAESTLWMEAQLMMEGNGGRIVTEGTVAESVREREDDE